MNRNQNDTINVSVTLFCAALFFIAALLYPVASFGQSSPLSGSSYYIQNVYTGKYMSADKSGRLVLSDTPIMLITLETCETDKDIYKQNTPYGYLSATTFSTATFCNGNGMFDQWIIKATGDGSVYNIGLRNSDINTFTFLEWNDYFASVTRTPYTPANNNAEAQWRLMRPEEIESPTVILDETSETYTMPAFTSPATVKLKRKITIGAWNTFCVPFPITRAEMEEKFGSDIYVAEYTGLYGSLLRFSTYNGTLEAGVPYLIKPTESNVDDEGYLVFDNVTTFVSEPTIVNPTNNYAYIPTFVKTTAKAGGYAFSGNKLMYLTVDNPLKGFRAYFYDVTQSAAKLSGDWSLEDTTTGISEIITDKADDEVYNIGGQHIDNGNMTKGVFIVNGKKVIVK